jgi:hypothetical protein
MKIEVNCLHCQALLRVDAEHAGKQLRCPACNNLSPIPAMVQDNKFSQPLQDAEQPQPEYINSPAPAVSSPRIDALVFGILSILLNFGCGCLFPACLVLSLIGLYLTVTSDCQYPRVSVAANVIGLLISFIWMMMFLVS